MLVKKAKGSWGSVVALVVAESLSFEQISAFLQNPGLAGERGVVLEKLGGNMGPGGLAGAREDPGIVEVENEDLIETAQPNNLSESAKSGQNQPKNL